MSVGGVAVVAAVIIGVLAFRGGEPAQSVAATPAAAPARRQPKDPAVEAPPPHDPLLDGVPAASQAPASPAPDAVVPTQPPAPVVPAPAAPVRHNKVIDLMPMIDPVVATVAGSWRYENGDLVSDNGRPATLQIPYTPPPEYDFHIEFTPTGDNTSVQQHLHKAPYSFSWAMGTTHDCGFEFVDNKHVWDSPFKATDRLRPNQRYTAVVRVRDGNAQAFLNGKRVVNATTDYAGFTKNPEFAQPDETRLGLGSFHTPVRFHKVEVIEVTPGSK